MTDDTSSHDIDQEPASTGAAASQGVEASAEKAREGVATAASLALEAAQHSRVAMDAAVDDTARAFETARDRLLQLPGSDALAGNELVAQMTSGADVFNKAFGSGYEQASKGFAAFNARAIEAWRANAEASIAHWQSLAGVKSWSEMIALNATHTRQQIETMTAQTRDLIDLAGRMARDTTEASKTSKPPR